MLVLARLVNQRVVIGDGLVTVTIVDIRGDKVMLGFDAPAHVTVDREEIHRAKEMEANGGEKEGIGNPL